MQPEPHHVHRHGPTHGYDHPHTRHAEDATFPPSSPNLSTAFHRHHQPTAPFTETDTRPGLKHRHTSQSTTDRMTIAIATPLSDRDRRKERTVATSLTVAEFKDLIASDDEDKWERHGMRLVWQGRMIRDEEELGQVVGKREPGYVHTFHLVARRVGGASSAVPPVRAIRSDPPVASSNSALDHPAESSRVVQALTDSTHYLLFTARHHLCHLLNTQPLAWQDTIPPPVVDQGVAREAIMSVVGAYAARRSVREEGWENWEGAFEEDSSVSEAAAKRTSHEMEIRSLWSSAVGTNWKDEAAGEVTTIELDGIPYQLHLPPLSLLTPTQLSHLVVYLRITNLLPLLNNVLENAQQEEPQPTPTPTIADLVARVEALTARPPPVQVRLRINISTLTHIAFNGFKVGIALFMLASQLRFDNIALWILGGGLFGWWLGDAIETIRPGLIWGTPPAAAGQNDNVAAQPAVDAPLNAGAVAAAGRAGLPVLPTLVRPGPLAVPAPITLVTQTIPLVHLETDSEQLHLAPTRPWYQPPRIVTQFLLPVSLWFITFFPAWERKRARAIRQREREMRNRVQELTAATAEALEPARGEEGQDEALATEQERPPVFPPNLGQAAIKYYARVVARGEEIDWEEEREAQRAMGVEE